MNQFLRLALSAALFAVAVFTFSGSVYLAGSEPSTWPRPLIFMGAILATAILLTAAFINNGRPTLGCSTTNIQAALGCRTSTEYKGYSVDASSIIYHYEHSYALRSPTNVARPRTGSVQESLRCHRCGAELSLKVHSVSAARRNTLVFHAGWSALIFGGWSIFWWFYLSMPPKDTVLLGLPALFGVVMSIQAVSEYFKVWRSTTLARASDWHIGDHRWFSLDRQALENPIRSAA